MAFSIEKEFTLIRGFDRLLSVRWLVLSATLLFELTAVVFLFEVPTVGNVSDWPAWLFGNSREIWHIGVWFSTAVFLLIIPRISIIFSHLKAQSVRYPWWVRFFLHLLSFSVFLFVTLLIFSKPTNPAYLSGVWLLIWLVSAGAVLFFWLLAWAPKEFWLWLIRQEYKALFLGAALGLYIWIVVGMLVRQEAPLAQKELWEFLSGWTLYLASSVLGYVYPDLIYLPETLLIGTDSFQVEISYACSGIEGISLITLFIAVYLCLFRKDLRFPQVLWLFPLGIIAIWLANVVRIIALVIVGASFSPEMAGRSFHTHAGWVVFIIIAFGAIIMSQRKWFASADHSIVHSVSHSEHAIADAFLIPFILLMATSIVTAPFSVGFDLLYPLRVVIASAALWYYRKIYELLNWRWSWEAVLIGVMVFVPWILLEPAVDSNTNALAQGLAERSSIIVILWFLFRVLGSVIVVPVVEELAFRGYLLRKLISKDFNRVSFQHFTWFSFLFSSLLFGLLHGRWFVGALAGMAYAFALYRKGRISDAVLAHMTTNGLIALTVLTQERWALW